MPSQERVNWAKVRVAAVCAAAVTILLTLFWLLSGGTLFEEKASLYLYIPDATGLDSDSPVTVDGITVGKVKDVSLSGSNDPNRVIRVTISVEHKQLAVIPVDSYAAADALTMIGDKYIAITSGHMPNSIRAGSELTYREKPDITKRLDMRQFEEQLRIIDQTLTDIEQKRSLVGQFILNDDMYRELIRRFTQIRDDIRITVNQGTLIGKAVRTDELYRRIGDTFVALDQGLARLQSGQGPMGQFLHDPAQYQQVLATIRDFHKSITDLRASDFVQSDAMYSQLNRNLDSIIQTVENANVNPLLNSTADYEQYNGMAREWAHTVHEFRTDPRKFLRLKIF